MIDPIDLNPNHLATVKAILAEHVPECEVRAFGSRVTWTAKDYSDLDLAVVGEGPLDWRTLGRLKEAFEESDLPMRVDVLDWYAIPDSFRRVIERDYEVIQKGKEPHDVHEESLWGRVSLGSVIDLRLSSVDKKSKPNEHPVRLCNYMDVYSNNFIRADMDFMAATATDREIAKCALVPGDVVITKDSEKYDDIGVPALVREDVPGLVCGYHLAILRPRPAELDGSYLFYALSTREAQHQFHSYANGVTRFGLRKADIGLVEIPKPPPSEQRAIAHVLGTLDDKIELNRRMNETLEEMARALFKSWFVDFDPVRAKMEGRWRRGKSLPGLPSELYDLFPDRLVDSELGHIPEGWEVKALGKCAEIERGLSYKGSGLSSDGVPMHNLNSIQEGGGYKNDGIKYYNGDYQDRHVAHPGDVLVANTEQGHDRLLIGFAAIVPRHLGNHGLFSHHLYRTTPNRSSGLSADYVCQLFNTRSMHGTVSGYATGTTVNMLPADALRIPSIVVPPMRLVTMFSRVAEAARETQYSLLIECQHLAAQRDGLLSRLVSGEM